MRVLWIANIVFPEAHALIASDDKLKASGGWMLGAAESLLNHTDISLTVASVSPMVNELIRLEGKRIIYYLLPYGKGNNRYNKEYEPLWLRVKEEVCPNVVHIHGSEYTHGLAYVRACGSKNVVVSIQGLVSVYARYYYSGLSKWNVLRNFTLRSLLGRSIFAGKKSFKKRGVLERELLQKVDHIIGRTSWDQAHAWAINPYAQYHYVGETLRRDFYDGQWNYSRCNHHTIFLSQANYAVKGLHMVLKALPLVLRQYPDVQVRVDGNDITSCDSLKKVLQYTDYGRLTRQMIKQSLSFGVDAFQFNQPHVFLPRSSQCIRFSPPCRYAGRFFHWFYLSILCFGFQAFFLLWKKRRICNNIRLKAGFPWKKG